MKFGPVPVSDAAGAILAHSATGQVAGKPFKIAKGTELEATHLAALQAAGLTEVTVARLEAGDLHEDEAATRLAGALLRKDAALEAGRAATGRVNLRACEPGIVSVNAGAINRANLVDPGITVATVPDCQRLGPRGLVATVKIIPYAVPGAALDKACEIARDGIGFHVPVLRTATLIETEVPGQRDSTKGRAAVQSRLERLGVRLDPRVLVAHDTAQISAALGKATGDLVMILTGSATSDIADTAPEAVRRAGGEVLHYGMPVDPGNLLFVASLDTRPVIGLPGCARSPALNGADWVIERLVCGVPVGAADIMGMGVGGLLKDIPTRPLPRAAVDADRD